MWPNSRTLNWFSSRSSYGAGAAAKTEQTRNPSQRQLGSIEVTIQPVPSRGHQFRRDNSNQCDRAHGMNNQRGGISLVNVTSNSMRLILEDDADGILRFTEILARIDAHQRAGRTVFLT